MSDIIPGAVYLDTKWNQPWIGAEGNRLISYDARNQEDEELDLASTTPVALRDRLLLLYVPGDTITQKSSPGDGGPGTFRNEITIAHDERYWSE